MRKVTHICSLLANQTFRYEVGQSVTIAVVLGVGDPAIQVVSLKLEAAELLARVKALPNGGIPPSPGAPLD